MSNIFYIIYVHGVIGALCPSNAKRLYRDEKSTEIGEIDYNNRKVK